MSSRAIRLGILLVALTTPAGIQPLRYDLVITHGTIIDGSGAPGRPGDLAVRNGRIVAVGAFARGSAAETLDASGLVVAPGFIDVHTHADDLAEMPRAENFVRMGVTSIVAGNCGTSALDIGDALTAVRQAGASVNYATLIGHNTVRRAVLGTENRDATVAELAKMRSLVWRAMADGAVGLSTGLEYVPGTYVKTPEILDLARIAASAGGIYATHLRNEGVSLEDAVAEAIQIGAIAGCRVQISHLKVDSRNRWGSSARVLAAIEAARARHVDVEADQYAYAAASSTLSIRFPSWVLEGGQIAIVARLSDPGTWARTKTEMHESLAARGFEDLSFAVISTYAPDPSLQGLSLKQVAAKLKGSDTIDAQLEAARDLMIGGGASMVYHVMAEDDVVRIMRNPWVAIASDSGLLGPEDGVPHPRGYGNNTRVLGEYVRSRHVLALEEAIRKMTSLPAEHFHFDRRGLLKPGFAADITIFDPRTVSDPATYAAPHAFATGVPYVFVNGVAVVRKGQHTGARPGEILTTTAIAK